MNERTADLWRRAIEAFQAAQSCLPVSPDAAASRAYYAAFYAVSAWLSLRDLHFTKHSAVEAAVHRELVKSGLWPTELGAGYTELTELRSIGDYGEMQHVSPVEAQHAMKLAENILQAVAKLNAQHFSFP